MDRVELSGNWWTVDAPDKIVAGTLRCSEDAIELSLIGAFEREYRSNANSVSRLDLAPSEIPFIQGNAGGKAVTLRDCRITRSSYNFGTTGGKVQTISATRAYIGVHIDEVWKPMFAAIQVEIEDLLTWSNRSGLLEKIRQENGVRSASFELSPLSSEVATVSDELTIELTHLCKSGATNSLSDRVARLTESVYFTLKANPLAPVDGFDTEVKALQDLLSLACMKPCAIICERLVLPSPTERVGKPRSPQTVDVYANWTVKSKPRPAGLLGHDFAFSLADIGFSDVVSRWLDLCQRLETATNTYFGTMYLTAGYVQVESAMVVTAAEALHRELFKDERAMEPSVYSEIMKSINEALACHDRLNWVKERLHNEPSLRERLLMLSRHVDDDALNSLLPNRDKWASYAKAIRNDVAHGTKFDEKKEFSVEGMHAVAVVTNAVLTLVLMTELGLGAEVLRRATADHRQMQYASKLGKNHFPL